MVRVRLLWSSVARQRRLRGYKQEQHSWEGTEIELILIIEYRWSGFFINYFSIGTRIEKRHIRKQIYVYKLQQSNLMYSILQYPTQGYTKVNNFNIANLRQQKCVHRRSAQGHVQLGHQQQQGRVKQAVEVIDCAFFIATLGPSEISA